MSKKNENVSGSWIKWIERMRGRYFRKVMAHPEGAIVHDGDCKLYSCDLGVCTCGLHHDLLPICDEETINSIYPKFYEEMVKSKAGKIAVLLGAFERDELYEVCDKCPEGVTGHRTTGCKVCGDTGFKKFKMPKSLTEEQMHKILKNIEYDISQMRLKQRKQKYK